MTEKQTILTAEGLEKLKAELNELRTVKRLENEERLHEAISHGDLSETPSTTPPRTNRPASKAASKKSSRC